jgi:hypothetical protein
MKPIRSASWISGVIRCEVAIRPGAPADSTTDGVRAGEAETEAAGVRGAAVDGVGAGADGL